MTRPQLIAAIEAALADVGAEDITPEDVRTVLLALANSSYVPETDGEAVDGEDGAPGADGSDGREIELQATGTHLQWRYVGEASWINLIALTALKGDPGDAGADGADGDDGREIEIQNSGTHIQWRYVGDVSWTNLVALAAIKGDQGDAGADGADGSNGTNGTNGTDGDDGREIELQNSGTHIQWRYVGDVSWTNLVALTALKGDQGDAGDAGADGLSAYAIAVANGFVGDEAAWLASLVGADGADAPTPTWGTLTGTTPALTFTDALQNRTQTLSGNTTYTASGYAQGRIIELFLIGDTVLRTLAWPAWTWLEGEPEELAANKGMRVALVCTGGDAASVFATYGVEL